MISYNIISVQFLPDIVGHMKILLKGNWTGENIKLIGTFLINTLPKENAESELAPSPGMIAPIFDSLSGNEGKSYMVTARNLVLSMLSQILDEKTNTENYAADLLYSLTSKWFFLFVKPNVDENSVILAVQLLQKVCFSTDAVERKFKEGLIGLANILPSRFGLLPLYSPLWGIFCRIQLISTGAKCKQDSIVREIKPLLVDSNEFRPQILRLILKMAKSALNEIERVCFLKPGTQLMEADSFGILNLKMITKSNFDLIRESMDKPQFKEIICSQMVISDILGILIDLISAEPVIPVKEELNNPDAVFESENYLLRLDFTKDSNLDQHEHGNLFVPSSAKSVQFVLKATQHKYPNELREPVNFVLEILVLIALDSIFDPTKFLQTFDLIIGSVPPSSRMLRRQIQEFLMLCVLDAVTKQLSRKSQHFDGRVIQNVGRFTIALAEYLYQGYFSSRTICILDYIFFCTIIAMKYEQSEVQARGILRSTGTDLSNFVKGMNKALLFALNHFNHYSDGTELLLRKIDHNIKIILSAHNTDLEFIKSLTYFMQGYLDSSSESLCILSKRILRQILLHKPVPVVSILKSPKGTDYQDLIDGFSKLLHEDANVFQSWYSEKKNELANLFTDTVAQSFQEYLDNEMKQAKDREINWGKLRFSFLKKIEDATISENQTFQTFKEANRMLINETHATEATKKKKYKADYSQMELALESELRELVSQMNQERSRFDQKMNAILRWRLDFTEADSRIRKKMRRDNQVVEYKSHAEMIALQSTPKSDALPQVSPRITASMESLKRISITGSQSLEPDTQQNTEHNDKMIKPKITISIDNLHEEVDGDGDWEEVNLEETEYQKIQRLLRKGDHILQTINCARLIGLDLVECICLICQHNIYLIDHYFIRANGEIVDIDDVEKEVIYP